ncbi:hypothetical protein L195_g001761 [Trifolium pratense]|uniref:Uncharacterized protein n=1 Tax=Trifolium pratense TaxID=57577 RepID=A0A2K3NQK2_TRIPR|nr:hypothetical protein L195_g001761 [Trifolium pratense]
MYREGPEGTPYHTLMIEGYVDASVDAVASKMNGDKEFSKALTDLLLLEFAKLYTVPMNQMLWMRWILNKLQAFFLLKNLVKVIKIGRTMCLWRTKATKMQTISVALETLERAISSVRKYGFHSCRFSFSFANEATICKEKGGEFDPHSAKLFQPSVKNDVSVEESSNNIPQECSDDLYEIQNFRLYRYPT